MTAKVGINGFGRVGRQVFKAIIRKYPDELELAAIGVGSVANTEVRAHLLQIDGNLVKIVVWYDNVWAYATRCADLCAYIVRQGL